MQYLEGTIKTEYRTEVQRVEGLNQAPQFVINDKVYYAYKMKESYVTTGVNNEHHTLDALVVFTAHQDKPIWYDLHMNFSTNEWTLMKTEVPKED